MFDKITRCWSKSQQLRDRAVASRTLGSTSTGQVVLGGAPCGDGPCRPLTPGLDGAAHDQMQGARRTLGHSRGPLEKAKQGVRRPGVQSPSSPEEGPWGAPRPLFGGGPRAETS